MTEHRLIVAAKQAAELAKNPAPQGQYDDLVAWLKVFHEGTRRRMINSFMPYIAQDAGDVAAKASEAAAAITDLQQQVREARPKALEEAAAYHFEAATTSAYLGDAVCCTNHHHRSATAILALKDKQP